MSRTKLACIVAFTVTLTSAIPGYAQAIHKLPVSTEIREELTALKQELQWLKAKYHELQIASLQRDLESIKAHRLRTEVHLNFLQQDIRTLDEQMSQSLDSQSYSPLLDSKNKLIADRAQALEKEYRQARDREKDVTQQLQKQHLELKTVTGP